MDEEFDTGAILAQRVVPVYPTDTPKKLAARVLKEVGGASGNGGSGVVVFDAAESHLPP